MEGRVAKRQNTKVVGPRAPKPKKKGTQPAISKKKPASSSKQKSVPQRKLQLPFEEDEEEQEQEVEGEEEEDTLEVESEQNQESQHNESFEEEPEQPKKVLFEDDEDVEETAIEKKAKQLELKSQRIEEESQLELATDIARAEKIVLPSGSEISASAFEPVDLNQIQQRIRDIIQALGDIKKFREEGKTRSDYIEQLKRDFCSYYNYSEFIITLFLKTFNPAEVLELLEANEVPRPMTIRINTLKTSRRNILQSLTNRGTKLESLPWTNVGVVVYSSTVPIGATPEYLTGHYMLQGASSLLPVLALDPQPGEKILDMCAAPGGKTSHIAAQMKNSGTLIANDLKAERLPSLIANLHRMGVRNSVVVNLDGRALPSVNLASFDRVLLDAPCTGLGIISRDPGAKLQKNENDLKTCTQLQKELILAGIDCLRPGGVIVYCTCSISVEENEAIVQYALQKRNVEIVTTGLPEELGKSGFPSFLKERFHPKMPLCKRVYPHTNNMDGFFVCKLVKKGKVAEEGTTAKKYRGVTEKLRKKRNAQKAPQKKIKENS